MRPPALKELRADSKVDPDVLFLLISVADEWEGKITGASREAPPTPTQTLHLRDVGGRGCGGDSGIASASDLRLADRPRQLRGFMEPNVFISLDSRKDEAGAAGVFSGFP